MPLVGQFQSEVADRGLPGAHWNASLQVGAFLSADGFTPGPLFTCNSFLVGQQEILRLRVQLLRIFSGDLHLLRVCVLCGKFMPLNVVCYAPITMTSLAPRGHETSLASGKKHRGGPPLGQRPSGENH